MVRDLLDPFARAPDRAGLFLDFDGVLAEIASEPNSAVPREGMAELLVELSARLARVAVVSGRPVDYIDAFIPDSVDLVGLYGLEWRFRGVHQTLPEAERWRAPIGEVVDAAISEYGGAVVEPKGLSLTIHYRNAPDLADSIGRWVTDQAEITGLECRPAKSSYELHPPIRRDKGTSLVDLATGLDPVAYLGDDLGDLPAFEGLDRLAEHGVTTVRVAVTSSEAPPILLSRADMVVEGPAGAQALLGQILAAAESGSG